MQRLGDRELLSLGSVDALRALRSGEFKAEEYISAVLRRLRACSHLNLTTSSMAETALETAKAVDVARQRGERVGSLAGLPILVKDNIDTVGVVTSAGSPVLERNVPAGDADLIRRLREQGAIVLAKTNMHELASGGTSSNPHFGPVRNPWALEHIAGGSSGGSAAALAARIGTISLGTDTAGSVRIPAAFCGVVGWRPSSCSRPSPYAARRGVVPLARDLDMIGPIGRSVDDVLVLHEAVGGRTMKGPDGLSGVRLGVAREQHWVALDTGVNAVCRLALKHIERAGATLVDVDLREIQREASALFWILIANGNRVDLAEYLRERALGFGMNALIAGVRSEDVRYYLKSALEANRARSEVESARGARRTALRSRYTEMFIRHGLDALLFPTEPIVAPRIREEGDRFDDTLEIGRERYSSAVTFIRHTHAACVLGAPGISIPAGLADSGLPVGIELDGIPGCDASLLGLARRIEAALEWPGLPLELPEPGDS